MFSHTMTFWRRLLTTKKCPSGANVVLEDRRGAARHLADQRISFRPGKTPTGETLIGQIRNISRGGLNMVVHYEYQPGDMLHVIVPAAAHESEKTVLACVVHVHPDSEGQWTVGCTFARELTADDFTHFFNPEEDLEMEKRGRPRYHCQIEATYQAVDGEARDPVSAQVLNLSTTGVGLLAPEQIVPGKLLHVELICPKRSFHKAMLSCVVHVAPEDKDTWALGCNFITEMSEEDLHMLLDE